MLRAVPGLASLPFVLATLAFSPASRRGAKGAFCPPFAAGDKGSVAALPAARPCALALFGRPRLAPSGAGAGGVGFWVPSLPCRPLPAGCSAAPGGGGWVALFVRCRLLWGCPVSALSRVSGFVPSLRSVLLSGRCRVAPWGGSALGLSFRRSRRSLSGFVAVVRFSALPAARLFACSWGRRLPPHPGFCAVRRVPGGFAVSVPVCPCFPPCRSGLRALLAARAASAAPFALAARAA